MSNNFVMRKVDRNNERWHKDTYFSPFNVRAVLIKHPEYIKNIDNRNYLYTKLERELGDYGDLWFFSEDDDSGEIELYIHSTKIFNEWKINDDFNYEDWFSLVEQHINGYVEKKEYDLPDEANELLQQLMRDRET